MAVGQPKRLIVEKRCESAPLVQEIVEAYPEIPCEYDCGAARRGARFGTWALRYHKGRFLKPCPGTRNYLCCGYQVLNWVLGCPFQCVYCILQEYLGDHGITLFVNLDDAFKEIRGSSSAGDRIVRIGTGELADSLALETRISLSARLVRFFRDLPGVVLELKTKSGNVDALQGLAHGGHTIISWSVNPPSVIQEAERGTTSLKTRLEAARKCQESGYPIGIHFDPMIWTEDWQDEYHELVRTVLRTLDPARIIWISMGALRYPPSLHSRLVSSGFGLGELVPGLDGKLRYLRPIRVQMFRSMVKWIREYGGDIFLYLCMESPEIWVGSMGWAPRDMRELDALFQERIKAFWSAGEGPVST